MPPITLNPERLPQPRRSLFQRAFDAAAALVQHVRVDHRRLHVGMAQQLLDRADVVARLQQVRGEAVPRRVAASPLNNAGLPDSFKKRFKALGQEQQT